MVALEKGAPNSLIQLLLKWGADPHLVDYYGRTALDAAARAPNVWAIKRLIAENVDLNITDNDTEESTPVLEDLLELCNMWIMILMTPRLDITIPGVYITQFNSSVLNSLRALKVLALAGTNHVGNSFHNKQTQAGIIVYLNSFIPQTVEISKLPVFQNYEAMEEDLQEIRDIVHALTHMLSNPLSLSHLCRVQIRRALGRELRRKVHQLDIPLFLQDYLMIYKESDIACDFHGEYNLMETS